MPKQSFGTPEADSCDVGQYLLQYQLDIYLMLICSSPKVRCKEFGKDFHVFTCVSPPDDGTS